MRKSVFAIVVLAFVASFSVRAQVPPQSPVYSVPPATQVPASGDSAPLSAVEELTLDKKLAVLKDAVRAASPEELGKAIANFIAAQQAAVQKANEDFSTYAQSLAKEGFEIKQDPTTQKFSRVKKPKPGGGGVP